MPVRAMALLLLFWLTVTDCGLAVGLPTATFRVTVAAVLVLVALLTVKVKLSAPW